jgi:hypothetical protein
MVQTRRRVARWVRRGKRLRRRASLKQASAIRHSKTGVPRLIRTATEAGWKPTRSDHAFLRALAQTLIDLPHPRVAVLVAGGRRSSDLDEILTATYSHAEVTRVDTSLGTSQIHVTMAAAGRFDVIVDDVRRGRGHVALFRRTFFHLDTGGIFLVREFGVGTNHHQSPEESVASLVARLSELRGSSVQPEGRRQEDEHALARSIGRVVLEHRHLIVTRVGRAYAKLTEPEANQVLSSRGSSTGRLLCLQKPVSLSSRCVLRESPSPRNGEMPGTFDVPALSLREYHDVTCIPGQIVVKGNLLLPETYRNVKRARLGNRFTRELSPRFAELTMDGLPEAQLSGSYFFLDNEFRGHFGHALTEQVARLWAWQEAKRSDPDIRVLVAVNAKRRELADFELKLFAAAGIGPSDITMSTGPVRVERLVAATPMFGNPSYVHPAIDEVWGRIGRELSAAAPDCVYPRRIFCARRAQTGPGAFHGQRRICLNAAELESLFMAHGFTVLYTEDYSLPEQAEMFRAADVIAGYAGSAMFSLMFSQEPKHVVLVASESYTARNEYLIASVLGHHIDIVWCEPEIPLPKGRRLARAVNSPFHYNPEREGTFLTAVLANL